MFCLNSVVPCMVYFSVYKINLDLIWFCITLLLVLLTSYVICGWLFFLVSFIGLLVLLASYMDDLCFVVLCWFTKWFCTFELFAGFLKRPLVFQLTKNILFGRSSGHIRSLRWVKLYLYPSAFVSWQC